MSSLERLPAGYPRVFVSLTSPSGPAQEAFIAGLIDAIARHDMTPVRLTAERNSSSTALEPIRQLIQTCRGTLVIAMARSHVVEGIDYGNGRRYRDRYLATEWVQVETALAYQLDHPILVLREDLVHPTGLLDPDTSGLATRTFSLGGRPHEEVARIAEGLPAFRERLTENRILDSGPPRPGSDEVSKEAWSLPAPVYRRRR